MYQWVFPDQLVGSEVWPGELKSDCLVGLDVGSLLFVHLHQELSKHSLEHFSIRGEGGFMASFNYHTSYLQSSIKS